MVFYGQTESSPDRDAYMALRPIGRANLLMRMHYGLKTITEHDPANKHYDTPVAELTWLAEECKLRGVVEVGKQIERWTDRLRTIANSKTYGRRPAFQRHLDSILYTTFNAMKKWDEQAFFAPLKDVEDQHARHMIDQTLHYNTDLQLPDSYKKFMAVTADKGLRRKQFGDRDLQAIVTRTQELFYDMARRMPSELPHWHLAAQTNDRHPPKAWRTLFAAMQYQSGNFPYQLIRAMLHYTPETGLVIEQDVGKAMNEIRHLVQSERDHTGR